MSNPSEQARISIKKEVYTVKKFEGDLTPEEAEKAEPFEILQLTYENGVHVSTEKLK